ncbi:MAG TPA: dTDP-4-amino-4,6-dideoxygalactose transaminase [Clostridiaceae bacterium]|nr:dTDP-4-amino-4,6-dideoxygalactose transaminase [Clostridiaceae bacterium]HHU08243.1 dTDP-4-amino-4,6-dideoxygalactose transaminase [Clostridiaceae bacterium]
MISFNVPPYVGGELENINCAVSDRRISGDGEFTRKCHRWLEENTGASKALLTTSCTHALEMTALLANIHPGDEVIMPSFTFVSTANAFVLRGAKIVFVDIRPDTMNIDESLIEDAITEKTKAIVLVHYAGVACEMDIIMAIAGRHDLIVVEDAAQAITSTYKGKPLGTIGDYGCYSFHETKNISMGEGGALLIRDAQYTERAEIIREKGTNRSKFFRGEVDKYTWVDIGSSYLPSEINAAYLYAQLERVNQIEESRISSWNNYYARLQSLAEEGKIGLPIVPEYCHHNAHIFFIKTRDIQERTEFIRFMRQNEVGCVFHYIPLHSSPAGQNFGRFSGEDRYTTKESERLVRLPMFYGMTIEDNNYVCDKVLEFYSFR